MNVPAASLYGPIACCTCVRDRDPARLAAYEVASSSIRGSGATIAVKDNTASVRFSFSEVQAPLKAGEAIVHPLGVTKYHPAGDFVITMQFHTATKSDDESDQDEDEDGDDTELPAQKKQKRESGELAP